MLLHASALSSLSEICPLLPSQDPPPQDPSNFILAHFSPLIPTLTCFLDGGLSSARHLRPACLSTAHYLSLHCSLPGFKFPFSLKQTRVSFCGSGWPWTFCDPITAYSYPRIFQTLVFQSISLSSFLDLQRSLLSRAVFHSCVILVGGVLAQHQHGFDPQHQIKPGTVVLTCNPSTQGRNSPASATQRVQRKSGKHEVLFQNKYIIK